MRKMQVLRGVVPPVVVMVVMAGLARSPRASQVFGDWSAPINPGPPLNTPYNDNYAVLAKDQLTIYFTSNRPEGLGGDDLWFATRESIDAPWDVPKNMGARVNSNLIDLLPFLSPNEHVLYFYSQRPGPCGATATGPGDIWMTRRRTKHSEWEEATNLGYQLATTMSMQAHWAHMAWLVPEYWFPNSAVRAAILESSSGKTDWRRSSRAIAPAVKGSTFGFRRGTLCPIRGLCRPT
jgi:hypothetical protein